LGPHPPKRIAKKAPNLRRDVFWMSKGKESKHQCTNMSEPTKGLNRNGATFVQKGVSSRVFPETLSDFRENLGQL